MKERCWGTHSLLPFERVPKAFIIHLVHFSVMWINTFPAKKGISKRLSPRKIVLRRSLDYKRHVRGPFEQCVEAHEDAVIMNTNRSRTYSGILLGPTGNIQGTQKVFDVKTGVIKKCRTIKAIPMPQDVIKTVHDWARRSAHNEYKNKLVFLNQKKQR